MIRWLARLLPAGTVPVGCGLAVLGVAAYAHLAVAGHRLDADGYSSLAVLWALVFTVGLGLFMPIEQEISRHIAERRERGLPPGPVLARGATIAGSVLALLTALLVIGSDPLAARLFGGDDRLVWTLAAALAGLAVAHTSRGLLAGLGLFRRYGAQLAADGALRIGLVAGLGLTGVDTPVWYGLVLALAPAVATALTTRPPPRPTPEAGDPGCAPPAWSRLLRGLGLLAVSSLLAQLVVNVAVVNARLLSPADSAAAGAVLSALVLVRIPLFVFASLQAALLPGLSALVAAGDPAGFAALLRRGLAVAGVLGTAGGVPAVLFGPWLVRVLFDAPGVLGHADFAVLAAGTLAYLCALVLGQGLLAREGHRGQAAGWAIGALALAAVTLLPIPTAPRVETGYATGALLAAATMAVLLRRPPPTPGPADTPRTTAAHLPGPGRR